MKRSWILVSSLAVVGLMLAACGGGAATTAAPAPTSPSEPTQPPPAEGYQGGPVTGGGTITGNITYSGAAVAPETVAVDKDPEVCGDSKEIATVLTDASGGLANAVVRITDITSGKPLDSVGASFELDQVECEYVPNVVVVPVGSALTVLNSDGILHNIHTTPFDNAPLNKAQPATQAELMSDPFTFPEVIPVGCDVHSWMSATIVAVDNPYAVVTGADGSYTLTDVPAGTYTVEVWHAELGKQTMTVIVEAGGTVTADGEFK